MFIVVVANDPDDAARRNVVRSQYLDHPKTVQQQVMVEISLSSIVAVYLKKRVSL